MTVRRVASAWAIVVCASACGADGPDAAGGGAATVTPAPGRTDAGGPASAAGREGSAVDANGEIVDVVALDNTFRPGTVAIAAGTAIRWENRGRNDHNVLPVDELLAWGVDVSGFAPGDDYTVLFDTPGEYRYYCSIHGTEDVGMIGTIVVVEAGRERAEELAADRRSADNGASLPFRRGYRVQDSPRALP